MRFIAAALAAFFMSAAHASVFTCQQSLGDLSVLSSSAQKTIPAGYPQISFAPTVDTWVTFGTGSINAVSGAAGTYKLPAGTVQVLGVPNYSTSSATPLVFAYVSATSGLMNTCYGFGE